MKAIYTKTENAPYPRVEYKCSCGFRYAKMEGYNPDYKSFDYGKLVLPTGKCMRCKNEIEVKTTK